MPDKYLNQTCLFKCNQSVEGILFQAREPFPTEVKVNGSPILTNGTIISATAPGTCRLKVNPQGTPPYLPCTVCVLKWNSCSPNAAKTNNLLTEKSVGKCVVPGGELTADIINTVMCVQAEKKMKQLQVHEFALLENKDRNMTQSKKSSDTIYSSEKKQKKAEEKSSVKEEINDERKILKCPYSSDKEKCRNCEYANAPTDRVVSALLEESSKTPSQILRSNYKRDFLNVENARRFYKHKYSCYEEEINLFQDHLAGNEAHHVVSTNDVLMQPSAKFVLRLVNFYKFDINDAYNCILLAGNGDRGSFGSFVEDKKLEEKFRVMNKTKRQWHGGGHKFTVDDENFEGDYASKVTELLVQSMNGLSDSVCRNDD